jgi:hypothetical protein
MKAPVVVAVAKAVGIAMIALLASCKASGPAPAPAPAAHPRSTFKYGPGDGQTFATAVEFRTRSETEGAVLLLDWIKGTYPGYVVQSQEVVERLDRAYELVTLVGPANASQRLIFDISSYYRRFGNDNFPKPLR